MDKKQILTLALLTLLTIGIAFGAIYEAQTKAQNTDGAVLKARQERDAARDQLDEVLSKTKEHDAQWKISVDNLTALNQGLVTDKAILCAQLKTAKLTNPRCQ